MWLKKHRKKLVFFFWMESNVDHWNQREAENRESIVFLVWKCCFYSSKNFEKLSEILKSLFISVEKFQNLFIFLEKNCFDCKKQTISICQIYYFLPHSWVSWPSIQTSRTSVDQTKRLEILFKLLNVTITYRYSV